MDEQNTQEGGSGNEAGKGGQVKKLVGLAVVIVVIALGVYALTRGSNGTGNQNQITPEAASVQNEEATEPEVSAPTGTSETPPVPVSTETPSPAATTPVAKTVTVTFSDAGYSPSGVTIKKGDSVMFKNGSATETWPASAMHPTHAVYPTTGGCIGSTFDACRGLAAGESWSFQFNEVGKWNYHDHLNPTKFGSVTVTE